MRPVQHFSDAYLAQCRGASAESVLEFLEQFRRLQEPRPRSRLISLKIPEPLLAGFRRRCEIDGVRYQTQIKALMRRWLESG